VSRGTAIGLVLTMKTLSAVPLRAWRSATRQIPCFTGQASASM
jgi:hypothetical protein